MREPKVPRVTSLTMPDEVQLVMPADPEFLRLARVTAMGLASRLSSTIEEIDDLRIAIDELVFGLIGTKGRPGRVTMRYSMHEGGLEVRGTGAFDDGRASPGLNELSELILGAVADEHELEPGGASPSFRLFKRRSGS
jgi:anti-sigma regulatory factor (Ser/Thr protein kinase)